MFAKRSLETESIDTVENRIQELVAVIGTKRTDVRLNRYQPDGSEIMWTGDSKISIEGKDVPVDLDVHDPSHLIAGKATGCYETHSTNGGQVSKTFLIDGEVKYQTPSTKNPSPYQTNFFELVDSVLQS